MVVYYGYNQNNRTRVALVSLSEKDSYSYIAEMIDQMKIKGWNIIRDTQYRMVCEVLDKEDYNDFMNDWKECKNEISNL